MLCLDKYTLWREIFLASETLYYINFSQDLSAFVVNNADDMDKIMTMGKLKFLWRMKFINIYFVDKLFYGIFCDKTFLSELLAFNTYIYQHGWLLETYGN